MKEQQLKQANIQCQVTKNCLAMLERFNAPEDDDSGSSSYSMDSSGSDDSESERESKKPRLEPIPDLRNLSWNNINSLEVDSASIFGICLAF